MKGYKMFRELPQSVIQGETLVDNTDFYTDPIEALHSAGHSGNVHFFLVESVGAWAGTPYGSRVTCDAIRLLREMSLKDMCEASAAISGCVPTVDYRADWECVITDGDQSQISYMGAYSVAVNMGSMQTIAHNGGDYSEAIAKGDYSVALSTGLNARALNSGDDSIALSKGRAGAAIVGGCRALAMATGEEAAAISLGDMSRAAVSAEQAVAVSLGALAQARGGIGSWLVLAERASDGVTIVNIKTARVDGIHIKADTFYALVDGEFVEA